MSNHENRSRAVVRTNTFRLSREARQFWGQTTDGPSPHVAGGVEVRMKTKPTFLAKKRGLVLAVSFVAMAALAACAAGVSWIDDGDRNTGNRSLVLDKVPELIERPAKVTRSLLLANRCPFEDAPEVFKGDSTYGAFTGIDEPFADLVVYVLAKSGFTAGKATKLFLCSPGPLSLKAATIAVVTAANTLYGFSAMASSVGICRDVCDAEVDTQEIVNLDWRTVGKVDCGVEVELPLAVDKIDLPLEAVESLALVLAKGNRHDLPPAHAPNANPIETLERQDIVVVGDCAVRLEPWTLALVPPKALRCFSDRSDSHLCCQAEFVPEPAIAQFLNARGTK